MMARGRRSTCKPGPTVIDAALAAMNREELRGLIRDMIPWLDEQNHARLVNAIVDRASRGDSGWVPPGPSAAHVAEVAAFAESAKQLGYADPSEFDDYLRQGSNAFLSRDYHAASSIFRALLLPLARAEIDLGQHEMLDEVLGVDPVECAAQYVVATYMTAATAERGSAVLAAIDGVLGIRPLFWFTPDRPSSGEARVEEDCCW